MGTKEGMGKEARRLWNEALWWVEKAWNNTGVQDLRRNLLFKFLIPG